MKDKYRSYLIHFNGNRPFKVMIGQTKIYINKRIYDDEGYYIEDQPLIKSKFEKVFIGENTNNRSVGKGNTILIKVKDNNYIYIGSEIYSFKTKEEITKYYSPIGNSDVPYPYAIDKKGNYYLFVENAIILNNGDLSKRMIEANDRRNPYAFYPYYYYWQNTRRKNYASKSVKDKNFASMSISNKKILVRVRDWL